MRVFQVDAFTDEPFRGNPAAVVPLDGEPRPDAWLAAVAAEMNLSETAFLRRRDGGDGFDLRWFTPAVEVDLCGHATLATAHVLWELGETADLLRFFTRSGALTATRTASGEIELDFPATPPEPAEAPDGLVAALGAEPVRVTRTRFDYLVELADAAAVRELAPDLAVLRRLPVRGVAVTAAGDGKPGKPGEPGGADFVSRFFAPADGVDEDPVTGSAHCALAPYWADRLGRSELLGYQASRRGGFVRVRLSGDRVILGGRAVTVLRGDLL